MCARGGTAVGFLAARGWVSRRGGSVEIIVIPRGLKLHFKSGAVRNNGGGGGFNEYRINITRIAAAAAAADDKCEIDVNQAQKPEPVRGAYDLRMYNVYIPFVISIITTTTYNK